MLKIRTKTAFDLERETLTELKLSLGKELSRLSVNIEHKRLTRDLQVVEVTLYDEDGLAHTHAGHRLEEDAIILDGFMAGFVERTQRYESFDFSSFVDEMVAGPQPLDYKIMELRKAIRTIRGLQAA
jgi:hypothetical protein